MRLSPALALAIALALLLPAGAAAAVRKVGIGGSDLTDCTVSPCATVMHAVTEANDGDTIEIAAGTYTGTIETTKNLDFIGAGTGSTTIRGPGGSGAPGHPAFVLPNGASLESLEAEGGDGGTSGVAPNVTGYAGGDAIIFKPGGLGRPSSSSIRCPWEAAKAVKAASSRQREEAPSSAKPPKAGSRFRLKGRAFAPAEADSEPPRPWRSAAVR